MIRIPRITGTILPEVEFIESVSHRDARGSFRRIFDVEEDDFGTCQISFSHNSNSQTLRGIHSLNEIYGEKKRIECVTGAIFDVSVDLRPESATYLKWMGVYMDETSNFGLSLPSGYGHGYMTLSTSSSLIYRMSAPYSEANEFGIRWDDPDINIEWPGIPQFISIKDATWKYLRGE